MGPPGVGKTVLVRKVVGEVGASLVVIRGPEVEVYINHTLVFRLHSHVKDPFTHGFRLKKKKNICHINFHKLTEHHMCSRVYLRLNRLNSQCSL